MRVLGISAFSHDSAASLVEGGEIRSLIEEERLNRIKYTTAFPELAIRECLREQGLRPEDVDAFAFFNRPGLELWGGLSHGLRYLPGSIHLFSGTHGGDDEKGLSFSERVLRFYRVGSTVSSKLRLRAGAKIRFVEHHLCHAASAFYPSPFDSAAILTWDGRGEFATTVGWKGSGTSIRKLFQINIPHSLGHFYSAITDYLGFVPFEDEWKVMGMSAYGSRSRSVELFREVLQLRPGGRYRLNLDYFSFQTHGRRKFLSSRFVEAFGPPRSRDEPISERHFDIAFAAQRAIEEAGIHVARHLRQVTGEKRLCVTGGVAQNILLNSRLASEAGFDELFIQPVATDAGASAGAALQVSFEMKPGQERKVLRDVYLGPEFDRARILGALAAKGLLFEECSDVTIPVARELAQGKIVGWFQGRMEAGPRALGNRSLLSSPCKLEFKERLNARIKRRESFRPFAPAVLAEKAEQYFDGIVPSGARYMIASSRVRPGAEAAIPAVVHVDGSARVQTVSREANPRFHALIEEFERHTSVPVLLNTSFNEREPIVCTPEDAIETFRRTEIDLLAIGDFLVRKGR